MSSTSRALCTARRMHPVVHTENAHSWLRTSAETPHMLSLAPCDKRFQVHHHHGQHLAAFTRYSSIHDSRRLHIVYLELGLPAMKPGMFIPDMARNARMCLPKRRSVTRYQLSGAKTLLERLSHGTSARPRHSIKHHWQSGLAPMRRNHSRGYHWYLVVHKLRR
jgi:hypothetical protein